MTNRILFLNRFYWPDEPATSQLLTDLAERLAAAKMNIAVIASRPSGPALAADQTRNGVSILRCASPRMQRGGVLGKLVSFGTFYLAGSWRLFREAKEGDVLVCLTDPPLFAVSATLIARFRKARVVHWVQDIYPEVAAAVSGNRAILLLRGPRNWAWRRASACVTIGEEMASVLVGAGVSRERITIIPNWAPAGVHETSPEASESRRTFWGLKERFLVMYSGNLGRVHALEPILDLAEALRDRPDIGIVVLGGGAGKIRLQAEAGRRKLGSMHFLPPQPRDQLSESLGAGDIHLVTLRPGCQAYVFPSKLYGILGVGRPTLFLGPTSSEIAQLVESNGFGKAFSTDDIGTSVSFITTLADTPHQGSRFRAAARAFAVALGGADAAAKAWSTLLTRLPPLD